MHSASFCNSCGARFQGGDRFCAKCGAGRSLVPRLEPTPPAASPRPFERLVVAPCRAFWAGKTARWIAVAVLVMAAVVAYGRISASETPHHQLVGSVLIQQPANFTVEGALCSGTGALADLVQGASVSIRDGTGDVIASDTLERGTVTPEGNCRLRYGVKVPEVDTYVFVIGQQVPTPPISIAMMRVAATNARLTGGDWRVTQGYD